jgi:O-antigen/teichoic acid export membrane protein
LLSVSHDDRFQLSEPGAPDRHIRRDHLAHGLAQRVARGALVTLASQWGGFVLRLGSTAILARLLSPDDYGLVAMAVAITGLAALVKDFGLSAAVIQREDLTAAQVNALFWINTLIGLGLACLVAAVSPLIATFFGRPELTGITLALAGALLIGSLAVQHQALLSRQMRFGWISSIEAASLLAGIVAALAAAALGAGYWALVAQQVVATVARSVLLWVASGWRPARPGLAPGLRALMVFGGQFSLFNIVNQSALNLNQVLIGWLAGAGPLGLFSRAYQLLRLPVQQINTPLARVAVPALSCLQGDVGRYRTYYTGALAAIALIALPGIAAAAALSEEIVLVMLGSEWLEAAEIFQVLAFGGAVVVLANTTSWLYVSTGRTGAQLTWALVSRPIIAAAGVIGVQWGAYGVAMAYTVAEYVLVLPLFASAVRNTPVGMGDVGRAVWRPLVLAGLVYLGTAGARIALGSAGVLPRAAVAAAAGVAVYALAVCLWRAPRAQIVRVVRAAGGVPARHGVAGA